MMIRLGLFLGLALIASSCEPAAVYVSKVSPIDLVACFVPDTYETMKDGRRYAVNSWIAKTKANELFTAIRTNFDGLDPVCDLKLVVNTMNSDLDVFAARSGRKLFGLERAFGWDPFTQLRAALYQTFASDPKLVASVQAERPLTIAQRPDPPMRPESASPPVLAPPQSASSAQAGVGASDVDMVPSGKASARQNAYAIVIGIEQYQQGLPKADFATRDAQITKDYLTKVMGYQEENVLLLTNERATKTGIEKYIEHWLPNRIEKDAAVFIYYSGHGAPNPKTGDAYLVPYDGDPAFVDATGYPLKRLYEHLGRLPAKEVVVMLDSCFSGAGGRSVIAEGMRPMGLSIETPVLAGNKTVVLAASSGTQVSSTFKAQGHGLLTYYFLKGLRGEADANKDGSVDLSEVFAYVKPNVERTARREFNNEQTPQLLGNPELLKKGIQLVERAGK
jgi:hypothetical protein